MEGGYQEYVVNMLLINYLLMNIRLFDVSLETYAKWARGINIY